MTSSPEGSVMVDRNLLLRKIDDLDTYRRQLSEFAAMSLEDYRRDWKSQRIVERTLQIMIECCADIANHVISDDGLRAPKSYADCFLVLQEHGVVSELLGPRLVQMAKFRNVVVHQYDEVDAEIVVSILRTHLDVFTDFRDRILSHIKSR
jgi:uncharacterized protein YutE (UPF0331/DUF86 family)